MNPTIDWHELSGKQVQALVKALLHAFPQRSALAQMLKFELDTNLDHIVSDGSMGDVMFQLVEWSQAAGKTEALFKGALAANSGNPALNQFAAQFLAAGSDASDANPVAQAQQASSTAGDSISATIGNNNREVFVGKDIEIHHHHYPADADSPKQVSTDASSGSSKAKALWQEKLDYLREQEAVTADPAQKFALKKQIEETEAKIRQLS